ncbi:hypothetical protein ACP70R_049416 [Stipagrostis hirtigluma subsp. patula]
MLKRHLAHLWRTPFLKHTCCRSQTRSQEKLPPRGRELPSMATERRRRRRGDKLKSKAASRREPPAGPTSVHNVPDHLLELIFLRLHSSACLLRAAATCTRWRRVVADAGFLSRFRSLHPPCIAGHYHAVDPDWADYRSSSPPITDTPVFLPSSSLTADSRRFSLDFLPHSDSGWNIADGRGSLLLLFKKRTGWAARARSRCLSDLVVCEPPTRRCQGILCPRDLGGVLLGVFLLGGDRNDGSGGRIVGMSSFRVVAVLHDYHTSEPGRGMPVACVFSPGSDGGWRFLPSASASTDGDVSLPDAVDSITFAGRANGSLYWVIGEDGAMLALDEATVEFSRVQVLADGMWESNVDRWSFRVVGGEDGAPRVVRLVSNELKVFARLPGGDEWVVEKLVRLPEATRGLPGRKEHWYFRRNAMIVAAHDAYILVTPQEKTWLFSVELETMEVERRHERNRYPGAAFPCELPWPPALEACADHGRRRRCR